MLPVLDHSLPFRGLTLPFLGLSLFRGLPLPIRDCMFSLPVRDYSRPSLGHCLSSGHSTSWCCGRTHRRSPARGSKELCHDCVHRGTEDTTTPVLSKFTPPTIMASHSETVQDLCITQLCQQLAFTHRLRGRMPPSHTRGVTTVNVYSGLEGSQEARLR